MVVQDQTSYDKVGVVIGLSKKAHMVLAVKIQKYMESEPEKRAKYFSTYNSLMETVSQECSLANGPHLGDFM